MEEAKRFKKWQWIEASVTKASSDSRRESYKIDATSIIPHEVLPPRTAGWQRRWGHVEPLISPSLEQLKTTGATLGLIKPATYDLVFSDEPQPFWTPDQQAKLHGANGASDLFGNRSGPLQLLEKIPVKIQYEYTCNDASCTGHQQLFEDWEIGESWRAWSRKYRTRAELKEKLRERYVLEPRAKDNLYLFLGTLARHPKEWVVIGHAQPLHLAK